MALTSLDFEAGIDFTALNPATGGDHNSLVEMATPREDSATEGKGIVLMTKDSALDTPQVPDASIDTKWQRYLWERKPHATADDTAPIVYAWDENAPNDIILRRWVPIAPSAAEFQAVVDNALLEAETATATANTALATANAANASAATALTNANDAVTTAGAVSDDASNALSAANDANAISIAAQTQANNALAAATAAQTTATTALNEVNVSRAERYICIVEQQNANVAGGANVAGANVRLLNLEKNDAGGLATVAAGVVTLSTAGTYKVRAWAVGRSVTGHQLYLVRNADNATLIIGRTTRMGGSSINLASELSGLITVVDNTAIRLDHYFSGTDADGLGIAQNIGPADKKEIYALLELEKLD
jgi:hypothetical protein